LKISEKLKLSELWAAIRANVCTANTKVPTVARFLSATISLVS